MRLYLLEHDPEDLSDTYLIRWAGKKGFNISQSYLCNNAPLPSPDDFDWLMVMGGSQHIWEEEQHAWLLPEKKLIADALEQNKMILGICFGAQLLAEALGGTVSTNTRKEIGWHEVMLTSEGRTSHLFENIPERFTTFHWHSDHYTLPPGCVHLAKSRVTQTQAFILKDRPVAGLQFHPEYTRQMITRFSKKYGHEWKNGPYVTPPETVAQQTEERSSGYGLMAAILDNMLHQR